MPFYLLEVFTHSRPLTNLAQGRVGGKRNAKLCASLHVFLRKLEPQSPQAVKHEPLRERPKDEVSNQDSRLYPQHPCEFS